MHCVRLYCVKKVVLGHVVWTPAQKVGYHHWPVARRSVYCACDAGV